MVPQSYTQMYSYILLVTSKKTYFKLFNDLGAKVLVMLNPKQMFCFFKIYKLVTPRSVKGLVLPTQICGKLSRLLWSLPRARYPSIPDTKISGFAGYTRTIIPQFLYVE